MAILVLSLFGFMMSAAPVAVAWIWDVLTEDDERDQERGT